jgi:hypothetical protein
MTHASTAALTATRNPHLCRQWPSRRADTPVGDSLLLPAGLNVSYPGVKTVSAAYSAIPN